MKTKTSKINNLSGEDIDLVKKSDQIKRDINVSLFDLKY